VVECAGWRRPRPQRPTGRLAIAACFIDYRMDRPECAFCGCRPLELALNPSGHRHCAFEKQAHEQEFAQRFVPVIAT
jgi:hypothetical protein